MRSLRSSDAESRAYLAAIEKEAGTSASAKSWLKFNALYGQHVMSRKAFLSALKIQAKKTGAWERWNFNGPQRAIEAIRLKTQRAGRPERYAILKARKLGVSVYWIGALLAEVTRTKSLQAAIVAQHDDAAKKLLRQSKQLRDHAPWKLVKRFDNQKQLYFDQPLDSSIDIASAKSDDPLRGATLRAVHVTEPQLWLGDPLKKRIAIEGCVVDEPGTLISYEGTGFGRNWWYDFWWEARNGLSEKGFQAIFLSWLLDARFDYCIAVTPEEIEAMVGTLTVREEELRRLGAQWGQIAWRRMKLRSTFANDEIMFAQEYPSTPEEAFTADGRPAFNHNAVELNKAQCRAPEWQGDVVLDEQRHDRWGIDYRLADDSRGALRIWDRPKPDRKYSLGVDSSYGLGKDNAVISVVENQSGIQVAEFCSNRVEPHELGAIVCALGDYYNWAYALVEIQGPGFGVVSRLKLLEYPMIGMRAVRDEHGKVVGKKLGFSNDVTTRESIFNEIRLNLTDPAGCRPRSDELCDEMFHMIRDDAGKVDHPVGKKNDRVVAWGVALLARRDSLNPDEEPVGYELTPGSLEERHWKQYEESVTPPEDEPAEDWSTPWM